MTGKNVLKVSELADRLGVERTTVIRWINDGHFPGAYKIGPSVNSPFVIPMEDVIAFEEKLQGRQPESI